MQSDTLLYTIHSWVWSPPLLVLLLGTGIWLTILLRGFQFRYLGFAIKEVFAPSATSSKGEITHFQALMTSLAGSIGTGSIVGVATAITVGGMGSIFWMWIMAFFSMATKYAESLLAVKYRRQDRRGEMCGGPMQYIEDGLGWRWMAIAFATFGAIAAIGTGNLVQVNAIVESVNQLWAVDPLWTGIVLAIFTGMAVLSGVRSIGVWASVLVPLMAIFYIGGAITIICLNVDKLPDAFVLILTSAFSGQAAAGGFAGATIATTIQLGIARSVFSNEAGLGISSIAAAAAKTDQPGRQAMITMTGALLSTLIVCTMTALVLAITQVQGLVDDDGKLLQGAALAIKAFSSSLGGGAYVVSIGLVLFAFSTVIAWGYYGEKCFEYLFGERSVHFYRLLFIIIVIPGAILNLETVWLVADIANGLMAIPNLIALLGLSSVITAETRSFLSAIEGEKTLGTEGT